MENTTRILAVDDSVTIRKALELILLPAGYQVEFAVNGGEAIEKAKQMQPDILLLDFILPDMRGTEVCRDLLADPTTRAIPVVLISARGAEIRQAYHDVENVLDYLTKPFTPDAVLGVLRDVLAAQASRAASAEEAPPPEIAPEPAAAPVAPSVRHEATSEPVASIPAQAAHADEVESEDVDADDVEPTAPIRSLPRTGLEAMFETLRAGLEGVYVEEMDTPAGAVADQARSYTDLASRLARQLGETLEQAESRQRFRLYGDGSIRCLDESLLDTYRRVCRLLFRAATAGAIGDEAAGGERPRLLVVCPRDSEAYERLAGLGDELPEALVFVVSSDYRQLSMLARLYVPTHVVVDGGRNAAVWDQIRLVRRMPEARRMQILATVCPGETIPANASVDSVLDAGPGLQEAIRLRLTAREVVATSEANAASASSALASGM